MLGRLEINSHLHALKTACRMSLKARSTNLGTLLNSGLALTNLSGDNSCMSLALSNLMACI